MVDIKLIYGVLKTIIGLGLSSLSQMAKNLPAMQETHVQSPSWEDPLEKSMATHSSIPCLENSMDRGVWRATVYGLTKESDATE